MNNQIKGGHTISQNMHKDKLDPWSMKSTNIKFKEKSYWLSKNDAYKKMNS